MKRPILSANEIVGTLAQMGISPQTFSWGMTAELKERFAEDLGQYEIVDESDNGSDRHMVILFKDHGVFLKITGFYSSYDGTEWNSDYKEVKLVTETVTAFK